MTKERKKSTVRSPGGDQPSIIYSPRMDLAETGPTARECERKRSCDVWTEGPGAFTVKRFMVFLARGEYVHCRRTEVSNDCELKCTFLGCLTSIYTLPPRLRCSLVLQTEWLRFSHTALSDGLQAIVADHTSNVAVGI